MRCSSGTDQVGKEAEGRWLDAGSSEPMCSCVLTPLTSSFAVVCSDFSLCAQAFACVLKLPKRLPMCAKSNSQHKDSHPALVGKQSNPPREETSSPECSVLAFLGILWVTCKCSRPAVSRVTEVLARAPAGTHGGPSCCPAQGLFSPEATVSPPCNAIPCDPHRTRDLHHESMSL